MICDYDSEIIMCSVHFKYFDQCYIITFKYINVYSTLNKHTVCLFTLISLPLAMPVG